MGVAVGGGGWGIGFGELKKDRTKGEKVSGTRKSHFY